MNALTGREQRLIAIAILIALVAIAWLGIARPLISGFSERAEERQRLIAIHQRNEMLVARAPTWRRQLQQQKRDGAGFAITAPNSTLATDILKERIARAINRHGGVTRAIQEGPAPSGQVRARADLELELSQLNAVLEQLQNDQPLVVVESLSIAADRAFQSGRLSPMEVRIEVSAPYSVAGGS